MQCIANFESRVSKAGESEEEEEEEEEERKKDDNDFQFVFLASIRLS